MDGLLGPNSIMVVCMDPLGYPTKGTTYILLAWRFMGSYKWSCKSPNMGYNSTNLLLITPLITTPEPASRERIAACLNAVAIRRVSDGPTPSKTPMDQDP